uniref:Uncharacterized protein n=1 Tax=Rhizophora mucronata TaxID=61149 RepID=A0A2P2NG93_RHIMU
MHGTSCGLLVLIWRSLCFLILFNLLNLLHIHILLNDKILYSIGN